MTLSECDPRVCPQRCPQVGKTDVLHVDVQYFQVAALFRDQGDGYYVDGNALAVHREYSHPVIRRHIESIIWDPMSVTGLV